MLMTKTGRWNFVKMFWLLLLLLIPLSCDQTMASTMAQNETTEAEEMTVEDTTGFNATVTIPSTAPDPTTPAPVPDAPSNVTVVDRTTDSLSLSWNRTGDKADNCSVAVEDEDGAIIDANCDNLTAEITNLTSAGREYAITVTAYLGAEHSSTNTWERTRPPSADLKYLTDETTENTIVLEVHVPGSNTTCEVDSVSFIVVANSTSALIDPIVVTCGVAIRANFTNLSAGNNYSFTATSEVAGIDGADSDPLTGPTAPSAPCPINITTSSDSLKVVWSQPNGQNADLSKQDVNWICGGKPGDAEVEVGNTTYDIDDLQAGTACNVTVNVFTEYAGFEYQANCSKSEWTAAAAPGNFSVSTVNDTAVEASWDTPVGGCQALSITLTEKHVEVKQTSVACSETAVVLAGLQGNGQYDVTIQTVHPDANGHNSTQQNATAQTLPSKVSALNTTDPSPYSVNVSWLFPHANVDSNNLTKYVLTINDTSDDEEINCVQQITFSSDGNDEGPFTCPGGNYTQDTYNSDQSVSTIVTSLDPCSSYNFHVYAENQAGQGEHDAKDKNTTVGAPTTQVTNVKIDPGVTWMNLTWTPPAEPQRCIIEGSIITYTYANCTNGDALTNMYNVTGSNKAANVTLLQPYWNYMLEVQSYTAEGLGTSASGQQNKTTLEDVPGLPTSITPGNVTHNSIEVSWVDPEPCQKNGVVINYNVSWSFIDPQYPEDEKRWGGDSAKVTDGNTFSIAAKPYTSYTISVATATSAGQGSFMYAYDVQTDEWLAGQVDVNTIMLDAAVDYSMNVSWSEPYELQGVITQYTVAYRSVGFPCDTYTQLVCEGATNVTISRSSIISSRPTVELKDLQPYQEFVFDITAWTTVGSGNNSDTATETTLVVVPMHPTDVNASSKDATTLTVTWQLPFYYPGPTNYTVRVIDKENPSIVRTATVQGYNITCVDIDDLDPYWEYYTEVISGTSAGENTSNPSEVVRMPEADPNAVEYFHVYKEETKCTEPEVKIVWSILEGKDRRGEIVNYTLTYWDVENEDDKMQVAFNESGEMQDVDHRTESLTTGIEAHKFYNFTMVAYTIVAKGKEKTLDETISIGSCPPRFPTGEEAGSSTETKAISLDDNQADVNREKQFRILVDDAFYNDETNGKITKRGVYVMEEGSEGYVLSEVIKESDLLTNYWANATDEKDVIQRYRVDLEEDGDGLYTRSADNTVTIVIGADRNCPDTSEPRLCNGELVDGRVYRVQVFVCTEAGCTITGPSLMIETDRDMTGVIVGSVLGCLILLVLVVLVIGLLRGRGMIPFKKDQPNPDLIFNMPEHPPEAVAPNDIGPPAVPIDDFIEHVKKLHRDSNFEFAKEYEMIKDTCAMKPHSSAELQSNRVKNRYINVLPFEDTRVKLLPTEDEEGSDYINGNFMMGYNSQREFLAMQGPLPCTIDAFWRCIWEQNCPIIVMVTNLKERGRVKCEKYWPEPGVDTFYGDVQVTLRSESHLGDYTIRILDVKMGNTSRTIKQFHFTVWPDFGAPETTEQVLNFVTEVRSDTRPDHRGPIMVHCSAGVGRTGTFIVVDHMLQHMREHDTIDIYGIVMKMRENRCSMVQTEDQYIYIYDCVRDAIEKGMHLPPCDHIYTNQDFIPDEPEEIEQEALYENYNPALQMQVDQRAAPAVSQAEESM